MERSLPSLTFKGSISEAIVEAKRQRKLFVVYISGKCSSLGLYYFFVGSPIPVSNAYFIDTFLPVISFKEKHPGEEFTLI